MPKNSWLCSIGQSCDSVLCRIVQSSDSALCCIAQSSDSALCCIAQSSDSALCRIARNFKKKVLSATPRYATSCEIQVKNFLANSALQYVAQREVDSMLCRTAESCNSALCRIAHSQHIFANFSVNSHPYAKKFLTH
jgi:hypothetical protein